MKTTILNYVLLAMWVCFVSFSAFAKTDSLSNTKEFSNSIQFSATDMFFPGLTSYEEFKHKVPIFLVAEQIAGYYDRRIYKNWHVAIGYSEWNETSFLSEHKGIHGISGFDPIDKVGSIQERYSYKMYDVFASYKYNRFKKHKLKAGVGFSYTKGYNTYVDSVYLNQSPPYDGIIFVHNERHAYYGIVPFIGYDYLCISKRLGLGLDFRVRKYFGIHSSQIDYGFHVAFNF
jgi:hypothetical protein